MRTVEIARIILGIAIILLGTWFLLLNWTLFVRGLNRRIRRNPSVHVGSLVPPIGPLLILAGAYVSGLGQLSFINWWVMLLDPSIYVLAVAPIHALWRHRQRKSGDA